MAQHELDFNFENLGELGGGALESAMLIAIRRLCVDMQDRPAHPKEREITIKIKLKPLPETSGRDIFVRKCQTSFTINASIPPIQSPPHEMRVTPRGLTFNPDEADNIDQKTFSRSVMDGVAADDE